MDPIEDALLAVRACIAGEPREAEQHLEAARQHCCAAARRHRQLVEIAGLVIAGAHDRARGLALVHVADYPHDRAVVERMTSDRLT